MKKILLSALLIGSVVLAASAVGTDNVKKEGKACDKTSAKCCKKDAKACAEKDAKACAEKKGGKCCKDGEKASKENKKS